MKILVISNYQSFHTVRPEAEIFIGLAKRGVEVHVMTAGESEYAKKFRECGISVIDFHPQKKRNTQEIAYIRNYITQHHIDILQLFNNKAIYAGILAAKHSSVKVVLYRGYTGNINKYDPASYLKHLNLRVDGIICNSKGVQQYLDKQLGKNSKTITINKGHKVEWYKDVRAYDIRNELHIPSDAFLLVTTANNRSMKGVPYLLKGINALPKNENIHLVIIGAGMNTAQNIRLIKQGAYANKIHLIGYRKNALEIVKAADAFVLASIKGESITKSVIEAMSMEITPIITDISGNSELVEDGVSGVVVPKKNYKAISQAILDLYINRDLCSYLGQQAKNHIKNNLHAEKTVEQYYAYYQELLRS